ncbi:putative toxin-antitoxin system toxin component, PIN family [Adlercreutzia sp. ZJ473]|uniref:putative toxin-antitoxin system toxin component, PIN family n=1 Tax=Adlercreutzia sp. ZJ473 TaxID=2722822 RepID=UPI001552E1BA
MLDTNVVVSAMISHLDHGYPALLLRKMIAREFVPVYSSAIMAEYAEVLRRPKFKFRERDVELVLGEIRHLGVRQEKLAGMTGFPTCPDPDDQEFYDVIHSADALLVTGNLKHFPKENRMFSPAGYVNGAVGGKG